MAGEVEIYKKRHDDLVARQERMRDLLFAKSNERARILIDSLMWTKPSIADLALSLLLQSCFQCWSCGSTRAVRAFDIALVCSQCGERYILFPMLALPQCGECGSYHALPKKTGGWACAECGTDIPQSEVKLHLEIERKATREKRFFVITAKSIRKENNMFINYRNYFKNEALISIANINTASYEEEAEKLLIWLNGDNEPVLIEGDEAVRVWTELKSKQNPEIAAQINLEHLREFFADVAFFADALRPHVNGEELRGALMDLKQSAIRLSEEIGQIQV